MGVFSVYNGRMTRAEIGRLVEREGKEARELMAGESKETRELIERESKETREILNDLREILRRTTDILDRMDRRIAALEASGSRS